MPRIHTGTQRITHASFGALAKRVPFSVSNFVRYIDGVLVGMYNRGDWKEGNRRIGCIGGSALITDRKAVRSMGAELLAGDDFRIALPRKWLKDVVHRCSGPRPRWAEHDVRREMVEELCEERIGVRGPVLDRSLLQGARLSFAGSAVNVRNGHGVCQVFRFFDVVTGSREVLSRLRHSGISFIIDPEDYAVQRVAGSVRSYVVPQGMSRPVRIKDSMICAIEKILEDSLSR